MKQCHVVPAELSGSMFATVGAVLAVTLSCLGGEAPIVE